mmetsp:Transcript_52799/g.104896  ORF Transcript_52799/g.104896 Transcript_52799/m.104896 type:complete len:280 (-) Transcript_52799:1512-2351(-)
MPSQCTPLTRLERVAIPLQIAEHLPQSPHTPNKQPVLDPHVNSLHRCTSRSCPAGSAPHESADVAIARVRSEKPPPQDLEHSPQSPQEAHSASRQSERQCCVPQGSTSSLLLDKQGVPPTLGSCEMLLCRLRCPPLQAAEHPLQSFQLPQEQSVTGHGVDSGQPRSWASEAAQCLPPKTLRMRLCCPAPHVVEQWLQAVQSSNRQSFGLQGLRPQPSASTSSLGHDNPPFSGFLCTSRCLLRCPPPQVASHSSHSVQAETSQSTAPTLHDCTSVRGPLQ